MFVNLCPRKMFCDWLTCRLVQICRFVCAHYRCGQLIWHSGCHFLSIPDNCVMFHFDTNTNQHTSVKVFMKEITRVVRMLFDLQQHIFHTYSEQHDIDILLMNKSNLVLHYL